MNARTLKALKGSIEKWERIVNRKGVDLLAENCPLCIEFNHDEVLEDHACEGCPVRLRTGYPDCYRSPWGEWHNYFMAGEKKAVKDKESKRLAQAELDFLKSLLPKVKK